ncbi:MAG: hypothetical protein KDK76_05350 [Chlamydiia bacterium]|nr:hypothetical protein [Chlamydiia bacterium]
MIYLLAILAFLFAAFLMGIGRLLKSKRPLECKRCGNPEKKECKLCRKKGSNLQQEKLE